MLHLPPKATGRESDDRGAALVELGIVLPIFFALVVGLFTTALAVLTQWQLSSAAQEGARVMYRGGTASEASSTTVTVAGGSPPATVTVSPSSCTSGATVTVTAQQQAGIQLVFFPTFNLTLTGKGVTRCQ